MCNTELRMLPRKQSNKIATENNKERLSIRSSGKLGLRRKIFNLRFKK